MDLFKGMIKKNLAWRLIHAFSKFLAGGIFLAASILLFPINQEYFNSNLIAGWLFRIGSIVWMISDIMQWQYYAQIECRCSSFVCNSALKCISTLFYFMGSGYLIPDNLIYEKESKLLGVKLFLIASILLMVSQTWKLFKIIKSNSQKILKIGMNESQRISIEYFVGFGGLFFFFGTLLFIFQELNIQNKFTIIEAFLFSLGGLFFFISGCIVHKIYFWQKGECQRIQSNEQMSQVDFVQNK